MKALSQVNLSTEVQYLKGVGPRLAEGLNKAGLFTVKDLLFRFPRRYEDRSQIPPIDAVVYGDWTTVRGQIVRIESKPLRRGKVILRALLADGTGKIWLVWFNQPWIRAQLEKVAGSVVFAYGQVKPGSNGPEIGAPEWEAVGIDADPNDFGRIVPVYGLTEGLTQRTIRRAVKTAIEKCLDQVQDPLPVSLRNREDLSELAWCLQQMHEPASEAERLTARTRLVFEEFFYLQLGLALKRAETHHEIGIPFPMENLLSEDRVTHCAPLQTASPASSLFVQEHREKWTSDSLPAQIKKLLPFDLTGAQKKVLADIWRDMASSHPMNRLVQGDVGSGKTAVAMCAMLAAVRSGYQAAIMAPTEILADQHYVNMLRLLEPIGVRVTQLVGKQTQRQRKNSSEEISEGRADIVVGTHALVQEDVEFKRLGLVVVDEQHRFGVLQRKALRDKSHTNPDVIVMTATPIPRTLTMAYYGDLDLSIIDELPPGRSPVKTHWKKLSERDSVYEAARKLLLQGHQAYFVCPLVSETEKMMAQAAIELFDRLSTGPLSEFKLGLLHGQMKPKDKETEIEKFRDHTYDALVSTTVVEVGVDVPNATLMVIENAERFGLSQLHQLRGRVGRGSRQSYCVLIADPSSEGVRERMEVLVKTADGFVIAEEDLRLRGPGMIAGTAQSGKGEFRLGNLFSDGLLLERARDAAIHAVEADPELKSPEWRSVLRQVREARDQSAVITVS
jgi:ATP-dependent DNA helicase RecG